MGRKILFITTDQQRYDALGCNGGDDRAHAGRRRARGRRHQLPPRLQPEHGVHAGAVDDADRASTCAPTAWSPTACRCPSTRPASPRTSPSRPATAPRCSARRTSSPASTRCACTRRTGSPTRARPARTAASTTSSWRCTCRRSCKRGIQHYGKWLLEHARPEHVNGFSPLLAGRAGRRDRRARDARSTRSRRELVPHRLGRRPHDRVPRLARPRRRLVRVDERSPTRTTRGTRRRRSWHRVQLAATSTCRPATPVRPTRSRDVLAEKPAHWLALVRGDVASTRRAGPARFRPQNAQPTTASARSTRCRTS